MLIVKRIPHAQQRYDTCGDWQWEGENLVVTVSILPDPRYEILIALHEAIEAILCARAGVTQQQVDDFDLNFDGPGEPGDHPYAPYNRQHEFASRIEEMLCHEMGLDWATHELNIATLSHA